MANFNNVIQARLNNKDVSLMKLNGSVIYEKKAQNTSPYYVEYTVDNTSTKALNEMKSTSYSYAIPRIYSTNTSYKYEYEDVEITLLNGSTTKDLTTTCDKIAKVKLWYPESTVSVKFYSHSDSYPMIIKTVDYVKTDNFTTMEKMFDYCSSLTSVNASNWDTSKVGSFIYMFRDCSSLTELDLSTLTRKSNEVYAGNMFNGCSKLSTLNLSNFYITSGVTSYGTGAYQNIFKDCTALAELRLDNCSKETVSFIATNTNVALPTGTVGGKSRRMYAKNAAFSGVTLPSGWMKIGV